MLAKLKTTVRIDSFSREDASTRLRIGQFPETGLELEGPDYLPELLGCLDGRSTEADVLARLAERGHRPLAQDVRALVSRLGECGLVDLIDPAAATPPDWSAEDEKRYYKHLLFYGQFHEQNTARDMQNALKDKTVALIGMGGIGSAAAYLLAAAGVGRLRGADPDTIELGNLTRQVLYRSEDVGRRKVDVAGERLAQYNPGVRYEALPEAMTSAADIARVIRGCDFAILSADSPARLAGWMNEAALKTGVPFTCSGYSGHLAVCGPLVVPGKTACLACAGAPGKAAPSDPAVDAVNARYAVPSFGPINHLSASLACAEALKFLTGCAEPQTLGTRFLFDPMRFEGRRVAVPRRADCPACSHHAQA